jgi:hypothetical protein
MSREKKFLRKELDFKQDDNKARLTELLMSHKVLQSEEAVKQICHQESKRANFLKYEFLFIGIAAIIGLVLVYNLFKLSNSILVYIGALAIGILTTRLFSEFNSKEKVYNEIVNKIINKTK